MRRWGLVLAGAVVSGGFLTAALPLGEQAFFAWIALVPLLLVTRGLGFVGGFLAAIVAILSSSLVAVTGVLYRSPSAGLDAWLFTGLGLFGFAVALTVAVWSDANSEKRPVFLFASLAVLFEACLLVELPAHIALTQYRVEPLVYLSSIVGIWGVSWVIWFSNLTIARLLHAKETRSKGVALFLGLSVIGFVLMRVQLPPLGGSTTRVAMLQTENVEGKELSALHRSAVLRGARVVVWPEFSGMVMAPGGDPSQLVALGRESPTSSLVTSFRDATPPMPHNVASLFSVEGESERYAKRRPFGGEKSMHAPGDRATAATWDGTVVGLNICFDSCYPSIIRDTARLPGVQFIALPTIDPPSRHHFIAAMHAAYSPFRAAESGVSIVRADGYAFSSAVDARGKVLVQAEPGETIAYADLPIGRVATLPLLVGDWWLWVCGGLVAFVLVRGWREQKAQRAM